MSLRPYPRCLSPKLLRSVLMSSNTSLLETIQDNACTIFKLCRRMSSWIIYAWCGFITLCGLHTVECGLHTVDLLLGNIIFDWLKSGRCPGIYSRIFRRSVLISSTKKLSWKISCYFGNNFSKTVLWYNQRIDPRQLFACDV